MAAPTDDISSPLPNSNSASPSGPAPAGAGTKRKRATEPKFYAVKAGFQPGVYYTWNDCLTQVTGYKGAVFQSFPSLEEANSFLTGQRPLSSGKDSNSVKPDHQRFYAIQRGRKPGVYTDWASAQEQIWRFQKPRYRKFSTRAEAEQFVKEGQTQEQKVKTEEQTDAAANGDGQSASTTDISNLPGAPAGLTADRPRDDFGNVLPPGTAPLPPGAMDGFDPNVLLDPTTGQLVYKSDAQKKATKLQPKSGTPGMLNIYTDGSSLRNGSKIASAGVGVYFGPQDDRNVSEPLKGNRQTNQRAELTAIQRALEIAPRHRDVTIFTDSRYAIDCVTVWFIKWRRNKWLTADSKPVENRDLVELILVKIEEREELKVKTLFEWVKGHSRDPGNEEADRLAVSGARKGVAAAIAAGGEKDAG